MPFEPEKITKEHVLEAVKKIDSGEYTVSPSIKYYVTINGKHYPPKEVMRFAHELMNGEYLWERSGGEPTNKYLKSMGFEITEKSNDPVRDLIRAYKGKLRSQGNAQEVYKWQLGSKFREVWNAEIPFTEKVSRFQFSNLLFYNAIVVLKQATAEYPDEVEQMFRELFSEASPLQQRIDSFRSGFKDLYARMGHSRFSTHQDGRTMATYLTFYDPERYTYFKDSFYRKYCRLLNIKPEKPGKKYPHYLELVKSFIEEYINDDKELLALKSEFLNDTCDPDINNMILAQDILYQTLDTGMLDKRAYWRIGTTEGEGSEHTKWQSMLNGGYISIGWPEIGDLDEYDEVTRNVIQQALIDEAYYVDDNRTASRKAGEILTFYESIKIGDVILAQEGQKVLAIGEVTDDYEFLQEESFPHIHRVNWKVKGPDLINQEGLRTTVYPISDANLIGSVDRLLSENVKSEAILVKNNTVTMNLNTILYGPPGTGKTRYIQEIIRTQSLDKQKIAAVSQEVDVDDFVKKYKWWEVVALSLFDTNGNTATVPQLKEHPLIVAKKSQSGVKEIGPRLWGTLQHHTVDTCPNVNIAKKHGIPIFYKEENSDWRFDDINKFKIEFAELIAEYSNFKNPVESERPKRYLFTTCHQSLSYEDFIEGIKPQLNDIRDDEDQKLSYENRKGYFYIACNEAAKLAGYTNLNECLEDSHKIRKEKFKAAVNEGRFFYLFLDEINRCNVSAVFGELITLIEGDKRLGAENEIADVLLPYSQDLFGVPLNLRIVGTMNTADRSVEALDTALRRRFVFKAMEPNPELLNEKVVGEIALSTLLTAINERISYLLDNDHKIGHSYFYNLNNGDITGLKAVFNNAIIPLLKEYFYNDYEKIQLILGKGFVTATPAAPVFAGSQTADLDKTTYSFVNLENLSNEGFIEALKITVNAQA